LFVNTILSTLNLSLQGVALKRDRMKHESEVLLKVTASSQMRRRSLFEFMMLHIK
ncbi:10181_t:CDS:2, partial [Ambispora leptoticha]